MLEHGAIKACGTYEELQNSGEKSSKFIFFYGRLASSLTRVIILFLTILIHPSYFTMIDFYFKHIYSNPSTPFFTTDIDVTAFVKKLEKTESDHTDDDLDSHAAQATVETGRGTLASLDMSDDSYTVSPLDDDESLSPTMDSR